MQSYKLHLVVNTSEMNKSFNLKFSLVRDHQRRDAMKQEMKRRQNWLETNTPRLSSRASSEADRKEIFAMVSSSVCSYSRPPPSPDITARIKKLYLRGLRKDDCIYIYISRIGLKKAFVE